MLKQIGIVVEAIEKGYACALDIAVAFSLIDDMKLNGFICTAAALEEEVLAALGGGGK